MVQEEELVSGTEFNQEELDTMYALSHIAHKVHEANAKWWVDPATGEQKKRNVGEMLMLCVSELAEAMEGDRKGILDNHLTHRKMFDVEIADCMIRLFDLVGRIAPDVPVCFVEKMRYNAQRADHKLENRLKDGGKKY